MNVSQRNLYYIPAAFSVCNSQKDIICVRRREIETGRLY